MWSEIGRIIAGKIGLATNNSMTHYQTSYSLIASDDSILIAVDIQDAFLDKLPRVDGKLLLNRACWLAGVAQWLKMPIVVTAEELVAQPVAPRFLQSLPANTTVFDKPIFGLADEPTIANAVAQTGRKTAVLIGLETDVCVAQSALGLMEQGYHVAVVTDATGSPAPGHEIGLNRMRQAGVIILSTKSLFYEWMRTVERVHAFFRDCPQMREVEGIEL